MPILIAGGVTSKPEIEAYTRLTPLPRSHTNIWASIGESPVQNADILTWQENESPFTRLVQSLKDRGIRTGRLGIEETVKYVFSESIAKAGGHGIETSAQLQLRPAAGPSRPIMRCNACVWRGRLPWRFMKRSTRIWTRG